MVNLLELKHQFLSKIPWTSSTAPLDFLQIWKLIPVFLIYSIFLLADVCFSRILIWKCMLKQRWNPMSMKVFSCSLNVFKHAIFRFYRILYSRKEEKLRVHWNSRSICWLRRNVCGREKRELRKVENSRTCYEREERENISRWFGFVLIVEKIEVKVSLFSSHPPQYGWKIKGNEIQLEIFSLLSEMKVQRVLFKKNISIELTSSRNF